MTADEIDPSALEQHGQLEEGFKGSAFLSSAVEASRE